METGILIVLMLIGTVMCAAVPVLLIHVPLVLGWFKIIERLERDSDDPIVRPAHD